MLGIIRRRTITASLTIALAGLAGVASAGSPKPDTDMGLASGNQTTHVTLILKLRDEAGLAHYIQQTVTPGSAHFQQFLTTAQFAKAYGASDAQIAQEEQIAKLEQLAQSLGPNAVNQLGGVAKEVVKNNINQDQNGQAA